jgi:hypothetical protein
MNKKTFKVICLFAAAITTTTLYSCKSNGTKTETEAAGKVDYQMLSNPAELSKWYAAVLEKFGTNKKAAEEVTIYISRPSTEGPIKRAGEADDLTIDLSYQSPADKTKLHEISYWGNSGGWQKGEDKEVRVSGGGDVETFKLEDYLFDVSTITPDILNKVVKDALAKYKDEAKYKYQYISHIKINQEQIEIYVHGKLASNDQEKTEYYKTDLKGVQKK